MKQNFLCTCRTIGLGIGLLSAIMLHSVAIAQETESQEFFEQGSEELNQQIRDLQQDVQQNNQPKIDLETPNPQNTLEQNSIQPTIDD